MDLLLLLLCPEKALKVAVNLLVYDELLYGLATFSTEQLASHTLIL